MGTPEEHAQIASVVGGFETGIPRASLSLFVSSKLTDLTSPFILDRNSDPYLVRFREKPGQPSPKVRLLMFAGRPLCTTSLQDSRFPLCHPILHRFLELTSNNPGPDSTHDWISGDRRRHPIHHRLLLCPFSPRRHYRVQSRYSARPPQCCSFLSPCQQLEGDLECYAAARSSLRPEPSPWLGLERQQTSATHSLSPHDRRCWCSSGSRCDIQPTSEWW